MTEARSQAGRAGTFDALPASEPYAGVHRRSFDCEHATVNRYTFAPGATFPMHRHPQEQVTLVIEGSIRMRVEDRVEELAAGAWSVLPGDVAHGITAGEDGASIAAIVLPRRAAADAYEVVAGAGS